MPFHRASFIVCGALAAIIARPLAADITLPFTEGFDNDASSWYDPAGTSVADWMADGGPAGAGDGFITSSFAFADAGGFGATLFRAQDEFGSSDGNFEGDWIAGGIDTLSFWFKHDVPVPVNVFARIAGPANFPGAAAVGFAPVLPGVWTFVSIPIAEGLPNIILEGASFEDVFSNVGHLQIGVSTPDGFEGDPTLYTYDLDNVSIVPAPAALALLALGGMCGRRRRRCVEGGAS